MMRILCAFARPDNGGQCWTTAERTDTARTVVVADWTTPETRHVNMVMLFVLV